MASTTNTSPVMMHIKLTIFNGRGVALEMRRFAMPVETSLVELQRTVQTMTKSTEEVPLSYRDSDEDIVKLGSVWEWEECQRVGEMYCDPRNPLRLHAHKRCHGKHGKKRCGGGGSSTTASVGGGGSGIGGCGGDEGEKSTPGEASSGVEECGEEYFYHSDGVAQVHDASRLDDMKSTVKGVLAGYSGDTIPSYLQEAIRPCEDGIDININDVADALGRQGISEMSNGAYPTALKHLSDSFILKPTYTTRYNIACCYALQGREGDALDALQSAVEMGYNNAAHMRSDEDLVSLHMNPRFMDLLSQLESGVVGGGSHTESASVPPAVVVDRDIVGEEFVDVVVELDDDDIEGVVVTTDPTILEEEEELVGTLPDPPTLPGAELVPCEIDPPIMVGEEEEGPMSAYPEELGKLAEMGFSKVDASAALEATKGDHRAAVNLLLGL